MIFRAICNQHKVIQEIAVIPISNQIMDVLKCSPSTFKNEGK